MVKIVNSVDVRSFDGKMIEIAENKDRTRTQNCAERGRQMQLAQSDEPKVKRLET